MSIITYKETTFVVDHAVKGDDYIHGYDANGLLIVSFDGIVDFSSYSYNGVYMHPYDCLTEPCNTVHHCSGELKRQDGTVVPPIPIRQGGTNATSAESARENLGFTYGSTEPISNPGTGDGSVYFRTGGDAVVEAGTSGIWTYRKWASGIAECWGSKTFTLAISTASGSGYYVKFDSAENYPFTFAGVPQQFVTLQSGDYAAWIEINAASSPSTTDTGVQMLVSTIERESGDYTVAYHVIGRWK